MSENSKSTIIEFDGYKIDAEAQLREIEKYECEQSLMTFLEHAWPHMDPADFDQNWHIDAIAMHLEAVADGDIKRLCINVPPRSCKTSLCSIAFPCWVWAQRNKGPNSGPHVQFIYVSCDESLSMLHSVACRQLIRSEWYQSLWGDRFSLLSDQDTKSMFANNKGGRRSIFSINSNVVGRGADIIFLDDANPTKDLSSEATFQSVSQYFDNSLRSRLNSKKTGAIVNIQQRVAEMDLSGHILEKYSDWDHLCIPMEFEPDRRVTTSIGWTDPRTEEGELLWPERFDQKWCNSEKLENKWVWAGQYQQRPAPAAGGIVRSEWWQLYNAEDKNGKLLFPPFDFILCSADTAFGASQQADHSACSFWGVFYDNLSENAATRYLDAEGNVHYGEIGPKTRTPKLMLIYAWSANLEFHELIDRVAKECRRFKVDKLIVEAKASGISVAQELKRLYKNERWMVQLVNPGNMDKVARLQSVVPIFANGLIFAPDRAWSQMTIEQVSQFPKGRFKDLTDTVSQALRHLRDIGLLETREEVETDLEEHMAFDSNAGQGMYF